MDKRFEIKKGKDGLHEVSVGGAPAKQVTSYTIDGPLIRFGLAGDEGATFSVKAAEPEWEDFHKAFSDAAGRKEEPKQAAKQVEQPKTA